MAALGQLVVSLTAETAQFRQSMDRAAYQSQKNFSQITSSAKTAAGLLAGLFGASTFAGFIKSQIDAADALNDLSERTGIATDQLSKLQYAAKLSDVSSESLSSNLIRLNKAIAETARGTGEAQNAFSAMGISVKNSDGSLKSSSQVLTEVATKFAGFEDGAKKSALAIAIFGKSGAELIPLLNQGADGINKMGMELERLGGVIMPDAAKRAAEFNDNIDRLKTATGAAGLELGNIFIPYITKLSNELLIAIKNGATFVDLFSMGLKTGNYQDQLRSVNEELEANSIFMNENRRASLLRQKAILTEAAQVEALAMAEGDLSDQVSRRMKSESDAANRKVAAPQIADTKQIEENQKVIERLANEYKNLFVSKNEVLILDLKLNGATVEQINNATRLAEAIKNENDERDRQKASLDDALSLYGEFKTLYDQNASGAQKLADGEAKLLELRERLIAAGYDQLTVDNLIGEARMNLADEMDKVKTKTVEANKTALAFGDAFSSAFENAIISGNNFRSVLQGMLQDIIKIALRSAITEPIGKSVASFFTDLNFGGTQSPAPITDLSVMYGGARASGGDVRKGTTYLVGERGPELFTAPQNGEIVSNENLGNVVVNQTFNISAGVSQTVRAEISNLMPRIMEATKSAVADSRRRGGTFSKAFS